MSKQGPALSILRKDGGAMPKEEQAKLLGAVSELCLRYKITNDRGKPVMPALYSHNGHEQHHGVSFLIYASETYDTLSEAMLRDRQEADKSALTKVEREIEANFPGVYTFSLSHVTK